MKLIDKQDHICDGCGANLGLAKKLKIEIWDTQLTITCPNCNYMTPFRIYEDGTIILLKWED